MKTAMIAILPALLLCGTAQAQLGGVTGTARDTVNQARDPALTGQFDGTTSRLDGPSSRIDTMRARQAERAARRAAAAMPPAPSMEPQAQAASGIETQGQTAITSADLGTAISSDADGSADGSANAATSPANPSGLDATFREQQAGIQAVADSPVQLAPPPVTTPRIAAGTPGSTQVIHAGGQSGGAGAYHTTYRETVVERSVAADPAPRKAPASGEIRIEAQTLPPAPAAQSSGSRGWFNFWPILIAGLLITLLLGLARHSNRRRQSA